MQSPYKKSCKNAQFWLPALVVLAAAVTVFASGEKVPAANPAQATRPVAADYTIGPGDVLTVTIGDSPEMSGRYRVSDSGEIAIPLLPQPVKAEGLTPAGFSRSLAGALKKAELLRHPIVNVFVEEFHSRNVTVLGAVAKPSVYPLDRPTTLLEVISLAGGPTPQAGNTVTVVHPNPSAGPGSPAADATLNVDLAKLMEGKDPSQNIIVQAGDSVSVSTAPIVYVVGAVTRPGGYVLQDPKSGMTILQALAMAQGLTRIAAPKRSLIVRREDEGAKSENIPVNIAKLMDGKFQDQKLHPNDILFIPESSMKKSLNKLGTVAMSAVNGMSIYGLGYRIR